MFHREKIDLLLLDLNLPLKSDWDVFERVTVLNPFLPIIIITGRDKQRDLAAAAGVSALMEKPLDEPLYSGPSPNCWRSPLRIGSNDLQVPNIPCATLLLRASKKPYAPGKVGKNIPRQ